MGTLVIAENDGGRPSPLTRNVMGAALSWRDSITVLVLSRASTIASEIARWEGVARVICDDFPGEDSAESLAELLARLCKRADGTYVYQRVLVAATAWGKDFLPRAAALLDVSPISDVTAIHFGEQFERPIYAGNAVVTLRSKDPVQMMTIRTSSFRAVVDRMNAEAAPVSFQTLEALRERTQRPTLLQRNNREGVDLANAKVVVSGGRSLGSAERFLQVLGSLAQCFDEAALGATRAAVDAGYAPNEWQIGQTGRVVAPKLYIAVGLSGADQHLSGMKDSEVIVAINHDPDAPIFRVADIGLVGDLFEVVPSLVQSLGNAFRCSSA